MDALEHLTQLKNTVISFIDNNSVGFPSSDNDLQNYWSSFFAHAKWLKSDLKELLPLSQVID